MAELAGGHGPLLARHAGDTIAAGGKRLRPLLVCLAAGAPAARDRRPGRGPRWRSSSCMAPPSSTTTCSTARALRRGRPTVVAAGGRRVATATGDLLFSRAFAELAGGGSVDAVRVLAARELRAGPRAS